MAMRRMGVVRGCFVGIGFVMLGGLAMVLGGVLVMLGCGVMMLDDLFFGHDDLREGGRRGRLGRARGYPRRTLLHRSDRPVSELVDRWRTPRLSPA